MSVRQNYPSSITSGALSSTDVFSSVEQVSGNIRPGYQAFYNGGPSGISYSIGQAYSIDGVYWQRDTANPLLIPVAATWEANVVKDPWLVIVNNIYYLYYAGWRQSTDRFQIGLAISKDYGQTYTKYSANPIIANGTAGTVDERRAMFPVVIYEADEANPAKRWKMWYAGRNSSDVENLAYATSSDGITWTKFGQVLTVGTAGAFDDTILQTGSVVKVSNTYYLFYGAATVSAGRTKFSGGLATFINPEGTYTKQGQNLVSLGTRLQNLTANTLTGSKVVTVSDTSVFESNEYVLIADTDTTPLLTRISSIDSATQLTLRDAVTADITTANSGAIRSIYSWSAAGRSVFRENGHWTMAVTFYQIFSDQPSIGPTAYLTEISGWAYNYNDIPTGSWTIDIKRGIALEPVSSSWDTVSAENFSIIPLRSSPYELKDASIVDGPSSATDNAVVRFDGTTGKLVQNSVVTIDDTGIILDTLDASSSFTTPVFQLGSTALSGPSAQGTYWGINAPTAFTGHFLNLQSNNASRMYLSSSGTLGVVNVANTSGIANALMALASTGFTLSRNVADANPAVILQQTHASSTGDIAQFKSSAGTLGSMSQTGKLILSGSVSTLRLKGYIVSGLPAGVQGDLAFCTDLLTPTFLTNAVGGGAVVGLVFYNGTNWITV